MAQNKKSKQEVVPLAEGDAQSPRRDLDPHPLGDAPAPEGSRAYEWWSIGGHRTHEGVHFEPIEQKVHNQ